MVEIKELNKVSVAVTYELADDFDSDKFIKMRLRIAHDGVNPNSTNFELGDMEKTKNSLSNIPILANVEFDEDDKPQFGGHDMQIEADKVNDGEYRMYYYETPIGVIPETNNYTVEQFDGKNYTFSDCYIWRGYSNYAEDIIKRDKDIKLSMEIHIDAFSFNAKEKIYNITDYRYLGITFLNNKFGTGMKNALATTENFTELEQKNNKAKEKMVLLMSELKTAIDIYNKQTYKEGGNEMLDNQAIPVVTATATVTPEVTPVSTVIPEATVVSAEFEGTAQPEAKFVKTFELSHSDIRCALYSLLSVVEAQEQKWYYIDQVFDGYFDYEDENGSSHFRQPYSKQENNVVFSEERIPIFVEKLTQQEKYVLDSMRTNYTAEKAELEVLRDYKLTLEKDAMIEKKEEIITKWSALIGENNEAFEALKINDTYTIESLEIQCKCIYADTKASLNFSSTVKPKENTTVKIPLSLNVPNKEDPFDEILKLYGKK